MTILPSFVTFFHQKIVNLDQNKPKFAYSKNREKPNKKKF